MQHKGPINPPIVQPRGAAGAMAREARPASGSIAGTISRLEEVVEQETAALRSRTVINLKDYNDRKNHGLLELTRALRHVKAGDKALTAQLQGLRAKLETNSLVLKMHLEAVREVSTTLADAIRLADSDGTYSHVLRAGAKA